MPRISSRNNPAKSQVRHRKVDKDLHWWNRPHGDAHEAVFAAAKHLDNTQPYRHEAYIHYLRMYSNRLGLAAMNGTDFGQAQDQGEKIRLNVAKSAVDTSCATISTIRTRALYSTVGGTYTQKRQAAGQTKFVDGVFNAMKQYITALDVFLDGGIYGTGAEKFWWEPAPDIDAKAARICGERVLIDELIFDDNEAKYGHLSQLFQHKVVSASILESRYKVDPEGAGRLRDDTPSMKGLEDSGSLIEVWRPPPAPGEKGRHIICSANKTVRDEEWCRGFPFAWWRWGKAPIGFLGMGLIEDIQPIQVEINYIAQKMQRILTLMTGVAWVQKGSGTSKRFTNRDGFLVGEYSGRPPIMQTLGAVSAEFFQQLRDRKADAYELAGISMMQATGQKPVGIEAAEALKTLNDVASKRHLHTGNRWEQFHLDSAERCLEAARDARAAGYNVITAYQDRKGAEEISFEDVGLDANRYTTRAYPTSIIPAEPAGKIDLFTKLSAANPMLAMYQFAFMSGVPDLEAVIERMNAPREIAEKMISGILEKGLYTPPYPSMNLQEARNCGSLEEMRAVIEGAPKERVRMLHRWNGEVDALIAKAEAPTMPGAMPGGMPPGAPQGASQFGGLPTPPTASPEAMLNQALNAPVQ